MNLLLWLFAGLAPLAFALARHYVSGFEGWGQWAAAPMLLAPLAYSAAVSGFAVAALIRARACRRSPWPPLAALLLAASPWLYVIGRQLL